MWDTVSFAGNGRMIRFDLYFVFHLPCISAPPKGGKTKEIKKETIWVRFSQATSAWSNFTFTSCSASPVYPLPGQGNNGEKKIKTGTVWVRFFLQVISPLLWMPPLLHIPSEKKKETKMWVCAPIAPWHHLPPLRIWTTQNKRGGGNMWVRLFVDVFSRDNVSLTSSSTSPVCPPPPKKKRWGGKTKKNASSVGFCVLSESQFHLYMSEWNEMCVCVCVYVCKNKLHGYLYEYIYLHTRANIYPRSNMQVELLAPQPVVLGKSIYTYICIYIYIHMYMHIDLHTYTLTYVSPQKDHINEISA